MEWLIAGSLFKRVCMDYRYSVNYMEVGMKSKYSHISNKYGEKQHFYSANPK